jgi:dTDP-4-amino-4,6-dideoxygalactose transaminase
MRNIPLLVPRMPSAEALLPYLRRIDANKHYTNFGPLNAEFEARLVADSAPQLGADNITTVSNCTVGLELAIQAYGIARPRVLIPSLTFVATATAAIRAGGIPVFCDVDPDAWSLTPEIALAAARAGEIDLVMPVCTFGRAQDTGAWDAFSEQAGIPVLIDAAGAYGNQGVGKHTDVVFSFHATKSFGIGEGGAVVSASESRIHEVRMLSNFGIDVSCGELTQLGTNGKLSEYHCAVGLAAFDEWEGIKRERRELHKRYSAAIHETCPEISLQHKDENGVYPIFPVLLPSGTDTEAVRQRLLAKGISTRRWYCPPLHAHPVLRGQATIGSMEVAEDLGARILGVPFFLGISDDEIAWVLQALAESLRSQAVD